MPFHGIPFIVEITDEIRDVEDDKEMVRIWKLCLKIYKDSGKFIIAAYEIRTEFLYNMVV